ncbi:class I SAM-dependent methyltransferase [Amycolatopsis minnesotensis]|uniref:Class I SAM-dependent methyltransferase n=1 Tax=Amycolatopsis minnesotensis TaxID=337894 RepID=A0ABN2RC65_9PSEU
MTSTTAGAFEALTALHSGERDTARELAARAGENGSLLGAELARFLGAGSNGDVYREPEAFAAFIRGGGNVELYRRLSQELAASYDTLKPGSLLDLGCGDGLAIGPALDQAKHLPAEIDLVEPSAALLDVAKTRVPGSPRFWAKTAQEFLDETEGKHWALAQSTFALQTIPEAERGDLLRRVRARTGRLLIAEFNVLAPAEGTEEHLRALATRYERGIREYAGDASLVAQGFLLPMLVGQLGGGTRNNWEQPAVAWRADLEEAGFSYVDIESLADYWWSPAVLIRAW